MLRWGECGVAVKCLRYHAQNPIGKGSLPLAIVDDTKSVGRSNRMIPW